MFTRFGKYNASENRDRDVPEKQDGKSLVIFRGFRITLAQ
jgi:hypothetical protein